MLDERKRVVLLGLAFLSLLLLSYFANIIFYKTLNVLFQNHLLAFSMVFVHNVIVISLVFLGMTFYVNLVTQNFFKRERYAYVVLEHPRTFASVFAFVVLFLSILRGANLLFGEIVLETLPLIFMVSAPIGVVEGYGIYLTIKKTLSRTITMKDLIQVYGIFLIAAVIEVGFIFFLT